HSILTLPADNCRYSNAVNADHVRLRRYNYGFERLHHPSRHLSVAAAMDTEMVDRRGDFELGEEDIGHPWIEMLAGMDHHFLEVFARGDSPAHRHGLDELGSRTDHGENLAMAHV